MTTLRTRALSGDARPPMLLVPQEAEILVEIEAYAAKA
jgi:hypothetical protein